MNFLPVENKLKLMLIEIICFYARDKIGAKLESRDASFLLYPWADLPL